jgi:hypothetical protein
MTGVWGHNNKTSAPKWVTLCSSVPTAVTPTSWRWSSTMRRKASLMSCVVKIWRTTRRARSCCKHALAPANATLPAHTAGAGQQRRKTQQTKRRTSSRTPTRPVQAHRRCCTQLRALGLPALDSVPHRETCCNTGWRSGARSYVYGAAFNRVATPVRLAAVFLGWAAATHRRSGAPAVPSVPGLSNWSSSRQ